jgi:3-oxoacyl-[acyl-carrier protein] reductase
MGRATAILFAKEGARVAVSDYAPAGGKETVKTIQEGGGHAIFIEADVSKAADVEKMVKTTVDTYGRLDILYNNAGVPQPMALLADITEEEWDRVMSVNLKAPFLLSQAALRVMKEKRSGYIINISSTAALQVPVHLTTYGTSKKALIGLSEALYEAAKEYGVKVSVVYPGMTDTEMLRSANPPVSPDRWMKTEDIVDCILFLLAQSERVVVRDIVPWAARHDKI